MFYCEEATMKTKMQRRNTAAGFTLVELLIVMSVILILMTLAIPATQAVIRHGNETSAANSVRFLVSEESTYNSQYPAHGFSCSLAALGGKPGAEPPTAESAQMIPDDLASGHKAGYTFAIGKCVKTTINNVDQVNSYEVTAVPNSVGKTGNRGYCADENGVIRFDPKGGTNCTELLQ
jgi:type IV pilus assembly protein PilA